MVAEQLASFAVYAGFLPPPIFGPPARRDRGTG